MADTTQLIVDRQNPLSIVNTHLSLEHCESDPRSPERKEWLKGERSDLYDICYLEGDLWRFVPGPSRSDGDLPEALQAKVGRQSLKGRTLVEEDMTKKVSESPRSTNATIAPCFRFVADSCVSV
jgi:hypothetical protein